MKQITGKTTTQTATLVHARLPNAKSLLMAMALTAVLVSKAWAGGVMPRTESLITADVVTVGDVFDGVTRNADHVLAPAPALGTEMVLSAHDLTRISEAFGFGWQAQSGMDRVVIRRDAQEIDRYQIDAALQAKLAEMLPGRRFEAVYDTKNSGFFIPPQQVPVVEVEDLRHDLVRGVFRASLRAGDVRRDVTGQLHLLTQVPVLQQPQRPGEVIGATDVTYIDVRSTDIAANTILDSAQLVGQSLRRSLPAMRPLNSSDVILPTLVKKGDLLTVSLQRGSIHLTAQGRALENGAEGQIVKIMNTSSRQVLDAVVTGAQSVTIRPAGT